MQLVRNLPNLPKLSRVVLNEVGKVAGLKTLYVVRRRCVIRQQAAGPLVAEVASGILSLS